MKKDKVCVAMSGGVDSACAAVLLKEQGYSLTAVTFFTPYLPGDAVRRAAGFCRDLGIEHRIVDISPEFEREVVGYLIDAYCRGETPNPCSCCNRDIKFSFLLKKAEELGCGYCATGHYARLFSEGGELFLAEGKDKKKSQEYFLALVSREVFSRVIFPLGDITKEEVKERMRSFSLFREGPAESREICFVKEKNYRLFIEAKIGTGARFAGEIRHINGTVLGRHQGFFRYTYGQREGLGISWKEPLYVVDIDPVRCCVVVGERQFLCRDRFDTERLNWFYPSAEYEGVQVKIRYNSRGLRCTYRLKEGGGLSCMLDDKGEFPAPGQTAVFYQGEKVVCAGIIGRG